MTAQDYEVWTRPLRRHPSLTKALLCINKVLTLLVYLAYPLLLLTLLLQKDARLATVFLTPAISFVLVSVFRDRVNMPRPLVSEPACVFFRRHLLRLFVHGSLPRRNRFAHHGMACRHAGAGRRAFSARCHRGLLHRPAVRLGRFCSSVISVCSFLRTPQFFTQNA